MSNDNIFKVVKTINGIAIQGINIPEGISSETVFFSLPNYGRVEYICTPKRISILAQLEIDGMLFDVVAISGHPFEECDDLEELVIPYSVRKIIWNGCGRHKLSKIDVHPDNPVFQSIDGGSEILGQFEIYVVLKDKDGNELGRIYDLTDDIDILLQVPNEIAVSNRRKGAEYNVPIGTTRLGNQSFKYTTISHLILPNTLKEIGTNVFYGCDRLKQLEIPSSVKKNEGSSYCSTTFIKKG